MRTTFPTDQADVLGIESTPCTKAEARIIVAAFARFPEGASFDPTVGPAMPAIANSHGVPSTLSRGPCESALVRDQPSSPSGVWDMPDTVAVQRRGNVLEITLDRPAARNAVDQAMARRMAEIATDLPNLAGEARVIVLRGAGDSFMPGGDVRDFARRLPDVASTLRPLLADFHNFIRALAACPQPVVCSVHGAAAGGGLSLALACDLVIAAEDTTFAWAYRTLGAPADGGASFTLPHIVGPKRAMAMLLLSDRFDAATALRLGLVNHVVPRDMLDAEVERIVEVLAANSAPANAAVKRLVRTAYDHPLSVHLDLERDSFVALSQGDDFAQGLLAYMERRAPRFTDLPPRA